MLPSPNRIDPTDLAEVALFADSLSITCERLLEIIETIGPMRPAIRFYAGKLAAEERGDARGRTLRKQRPVFEALAEAA